MVLGGSFSCFRRFFQWFLGGFKEGVREGLHACSTSTSTPPNRVCRAYLVCLCCAMQAPGEGGGVGEAISSFGGSIYNMAGGCRAAPARLSLKP